MTTVARPTRTHVARRSLAQSMATLRARGSRMTLESMFLTVGALCLPLGIVSIILGWWGAAHTGHLYEQNDYLISGGLLGLGLIFIGGFLYFGYWLTRQIRATETGTQQTLRALARLEDKTNSTAAVGTSAPGTGAVFVVTEHGSMLHRPPCPAVADKPVRIVERPDMTRYRPCSICMPD